MKGRQVEGAEVQVLIESGYMGQRWMKMELQAGGDEEDLRGGSWM